MVMYTAGPSYDGTSRVESAVRSICTLVHGNFNHGMDTLSKIHQSKCGLQRNYWKGHKLEPFCSDATREISKIMLNCRLTVTSKET
jgi:hypothetical protein